MGIIGNLVIRFMKFQQHTPIVKTNTDVLYDTLTRIISQIKYMQNTKTYPIRIIAVVDSLDNRCIHVVYDPLTDRMTSVLFTRNGRIRFEDFDRDAIAPHIRTMLTASTVNMCRCNKLEIFVPKEFIGDVILPHSVHNNFSLTPYRDFTLGFVH